MPKSAPDFQLLFESAPGLYLVLTPALTIAAVSTAYLQATLTKREEILGRSVFDVFPDNPADPNATGVRNLRDSLARVLRDRTADAMAVQKYDIRRPDSAGGGFEERYWSPSNSPVFGADREVAWIIHRVDDVTEFFRLKGRDQEQEKLAQELLTHSEQMAAEVLQRAQQLQQVNQQLRDASDELTRLQAGLEQRVQARTAELALANDALRAENLERQQTEAALRASEERFRLLVDGVKGYAIFMLDPAGRVLTWNVGGERITGYRPEDIVGQHYACLFTAEDVESGKPQQELQQALQGKVDTEGWRVRQDGSRFWANGSLTVLYESDGRVRGFGKILRDLTTQHHSAELLRSVLDNTLDGVITIDHNGIVRLFSKAAERLFQYAAGEVVGQNIKLLMPEPYRGEHDRYLSDYQRTGKAKIIGIGREVAGRRKDGTTFPLELAVTEFELEREHLYLGIVRDISARKKLEQQFHQAQKMEAVGQLAGGVAHDFNNLLTIISGYSELLRSRLHAGDPMLEPVKAISEAGTRAAALTRQLLAFSRQAVLEPRILDLNAVVRETEKMLRRLIGEDVLLTTVLEPHLGQVKVDPGHLDQVLLNLSVNARDAMPRGGQLTLETRNVQLDAEYARVRADIRAGPYVLLAVTDTGCGMSPDIKAHIFEPFFTTKEVGKGTGLGLSVVHGIVKQSGGHIEVYSELNVGTTFKLYFPVVAQQAVATTILPQPGNLRGSETILLVEDEDGVRGLALLALQLQGYTVLEASNGQQALRVVEQHGQPIELLVTDVVMPGMDGREVAERLRARLPHLKVLFTSGYTDDSVVRHGILAADVAFLQKPYSPQSLASKVRQVLDQR